jgi:hypothetical protein
MSGPGSVSVSVSDVCLCVCVRSVKLAKEGRGSRGEMSTVLMMLLVLAAHGACSERDVKQVDVMSQQSPVYVAGRATRKP